MQSAWPIDDRTPRWDLCSAPAGWIHERHSDRIDICGCGQRDAETASSGWLRAVRWRWPAFAGLALGVAGILDIQPWSPSDRTTWILPVFTLVYLIFGAACGQLRRPGLLTPQTAGLLGFVALALLALSLDPAVGHYVVAAAVLDDLRRALRRNPPRQCRKLSVLRLRSGL